MVGYVSLRVDVLEQDLVIGLQCLQRLGIAKIITITVGNGDSHNFPLRHLAREG